MRRVLVVSVALMGSCFSELPAMPGTGSSTSSTTTGTGSTTETSSVTSEPTGTAGATTGTTDVDPVTTGTTTGGPPEPPPGLFGCVKMPSCAMWDCTGACTPEDPGGTCVLTALRDRLAGALQVARCDKECVVHLLLPRGSGTDTVRWQWQSQDEPAALSDLRQCTLQPTKFFADCLSNFAPECADPAAWVVDCETIDLTCP